MVCHEQLSCAARARCSRWLGSYSGGLTRQPGGPLGRRVAEGGAGPAYMRDAQLLILDELTATTELLAPVFDGADGGSDFGAEGWGAGGAGHA